MQVSDDASSDPQRRGPLFGLPLPIAAGSIGGDGIDGAARAKTRYAQDRRNVGGKGVWRDGHWNVLVTRELNSRDADDVRFVAGKSVPVAFAVWNGQQRDRNGRKVISNWYQLNFEP